MKKLLQKLSVVRATVASLFYLAATNVNAALPATADPTNAAADGDYIGLIKGYAFDVLIVGGLIIGTIAFISVAKNMVVVYNEIGTGRKTWGDMGMHALAGVLLLVLVVYLLTQAATVIF